MKDQSSRPPKAVKQKQIPLSPPFSKGETACFPFDTGGLIREITKGLLRHFVPRNDTHFGTGLLRHFVPRDDTIGHYFVEPV